MSLVAHHRLYSTRGWVNCLSFWNTGDISSWGNMCEKKQDLNLPNIGVYMYSMYKTTRFHVCKKHHQNGIFTKFHALRCHSPLEEDAHSWLWWGVPRDRQATKILAVSIGGTRLEGIRQFQKSDDSDGCFWFDKLLPSGKLRVGPWFYHPFLVETHLSTPKNGWV